MPEQLWCEGTASGTWTRREELIHNRIFYNMALEVAPMKKYIGPPWATFCLFLRPVIRPVEGSKIQESAQIPQS